MSEWPACVLCGENPYADDGSPKEDTYLYQIIDGKIRLARDIVLHVPMFQVHTRCRAQLDEAHQ